jgi:hypothetical protein
MLKESDDESGNLEPDATSNAQETAHRPLPSRRSGRSLVVVI